MPDSSYAVLAPPRHTCLNSGGCCQGVHVKLLGAEELYLPVCYDHYTTKLELDGWQGLADARKL